MRAARFSKPRPRSAARSLAAASRLRSVLLGLVGPVSLLSPLVAEAATCNSDSDGAAISVMAGSGDALTTADGRRLRLIGFDAAEKPGAGGTGGAPTPTLASLMAGRAARASVEAAVPDRWGRFAALVTLDDRDDLTILALENGLGRYRAEPGAHACRALFLAAEDRARTARHGLWGDPAGGLLPIDDTLSFARRSATDVVAEGRLVAVQTSPYRTKLRFARRDADAGSRYFARDSLAAVITPRILKTFRARNLEPERLVGSVLRFRGLLDTRFGPQIELVGPDAVDVVAEPAQPAKAVTGASQ